uniref:Putative mechanosensitive ion channel protein n=1 Tax=Helianthus annuus TaxID=4232 RepID=A0A251S591_HELAN
MTGIRFLITRRMYNTCSKSNNHVYQVKDIIRPSVSSIGVIGHDYTANKSTRSNNVGIVSPTLSNLRLRTTSPFLGTTYLLNHRLYSSSAGNRGEDVAVSGSSGPEGVDTSGFDGNDLLHKVKEAWHSTVDVASQTSDKAKEAFNEVSPHVEQLLDTHPYLRDVIVPVGGTIVGTFAAWAVLPRIFRRFHKYSTEGPGTGVMVAPTTIASQFIGPAWKGAVIISFVWFLHRWKTNVITRALVMKSVEGVDRDKLLTLDKFSSVGLFVLGGMALAEACGVAVQSILTVGGIGGVATAFASRDILGNVLSGLSVQLSQPFSIGDTIKAGSVEGQVIEMGLTTTSLLSAEKFPIVVPNSLFSSQAIVNKSRAGWRAMASKIPVQVEDLEKIPLISEEIKNMMKSNANVFLEKEQPYCYLSRVERSFAELSIGCNLKQMSKDKLFSAEQDVLLQSVGIIKKNGASLASTWGT